MSEKKLKLALAYHTSCLDLLEKYNNQFPVIAIHQSLKDYKEFCNEEIARKKKS
jgi:hypothetical protein